MGVEGGSAFALTHQQSCCYRKPVLDQRAVIGGPAGVCPGNSARRSRAGLCPCVRIAEAAAIGADGIIYVDIAFADLADVLEINGLCAELFTEGRRPARAICQAAKLPFGGRMKVQAIAAKLKSRSRVTSPQGKPGEVVPLRPKT
ncbi:RidA family protein [Albidovulum sediminis]|uniref:RidA family protein n=1 Tax=Albidovulum sediminis TaxID=3066345 RepID=A0ABT2NJ02_9RHOB|nr:RidA family protein [Defluviimonas sediminis]MCT8328899.1 RidA family protein [Defluviimonas sediminis]